MRPNEIPRIDWAGRGYFAFPPDSPAPPGPAAEAPADYWLHALARARRGDFRPVLGLLDLYDEGLDPVFDQCCYYLLGDAGTTGCFALFADDAAAYTGLDFVLGCCNALAERGSLADVPLLLET
jgi:hypothetical protein